MFPNYTIYRNRLSAGLEALNFWKDPSSRYLSRLGYSSRLHGLRSCIDSNQDPWYWEFHHFSVTRIRIQKLALSLSLLILGTVSPLFPHAAMSTCMPAAAWEEGESQLLLSGGRRAHTCMHARPWPNISWFQNLKIRRSTCFMLLNKCRSMDFEAPKIGLSGALR